MLICETCNVYVRTYIIMYVYMYESKLRIIVLTIQYSIFR